MKRKKIFHENQLESLISCVADSKSFWSKLKIITCKRNPNRFVNITSQEWFTHFEQLFAAVNQEDSEMLENIVIENTDGEFENLVLNASISDEEILQAIKLLKKAKSGGPDTLLPDFLWYLSIFYCQFLINFLIGCFNLDIFHHVGVNR